MKQIKILSAFTIEIDDNTALVLDAGQRVRYPDGLADALIAKGAASTCMSDPIKSQRVDVGEIDPVLFSEDGEFIRAYLTAPASVRWHTPGKPANAANFEGREQWAAGLLYWLPRSVYKTLEKKAGAVHRIHFAAKRVDAKIDPNVEAYDLGWLPLPADRVEAGGFAPVRAA